MTVREFIAIVKIISPYLALRLNAFRLPVSNHYHAAAKIIECSGSEVTAHLCGVGGNDVRRDRRRAPGSAPPRLRHPATNCGHHTRAPRPGFVVDRSQRTLGHQRIVIPGSRTAEKVAGINIYPRATSITFESRPASRLISQLAKPALRNAASSSACVRKCRPSTVRFMPNRVANCSQR